MSEIVKLSNVESKVIIIREMPVIIDRDVAEIYGVETKRINEAVSNNPDKFPDGYIFTIDKNEKSELVENFDRFKTLKHSSVTPAVFTELAYTISEIRNSFIKYNFQLLNLSNYLINCRVVFTTVKKIKKNIY
jgi:hypothetical protein